MDKEHICYNCFTKLEEEKGFCPNCGYSEQMDGDKYPMALKHGAVLNGKYVVGRVLGQGGFGITYVAQEWSSKQLVAIKEYLPDTMAARTDGHTVSAYSGQRGESFMYGKECFLQEAKTLAEFIGNPNIVRVHSYFEENGTAYFAMDYIKGTSFDKYIKDKGGRISWQETQNILFPIMDALAAVHGRGIIHRDVTPDNIYITEDGTVKLLDFGAARYSLGDKSRSLDVVLKHGFAPKEQYTRHGRQGPYTDVYTVAATFYYAISGRRPPDSIDRLEEDDLLALSSLGVDVPERVEDAILKAMSVQPADRFQTMTEFKNAMFESENFGQSVQSHSSQPLNIEFQSQPLQTVRTESQPIQQGQVMKTEGQPIQQEQLMRTAGQPIQQEQLIRTEDQLIQQEQPTPQTMIMEKLRKNWKIPASVGGALVVVLIVVLIISVGGNSKGKNDTANHANYVSDEDNMVVSKDVVEETKYTTYKNNKVCFSINYPEGYQTSEQGGDGVLIYNDSDADFQVSAGYTMCTAKGSAIYSAEDFAAQIAKDETVLKDWIGSQDVSILEVSKEKVAGVYAFVYKYELNVENNLHKGKLYIFAGEGDFGCYSVMCTYNSEASKAKVYQKQCDEVADSFELTGKYQDPQYKVYEYSDYHLKFMLPSDFEGEADSSSTGVSVYPVAHVFSEANIWIKECSYSADTLGEAARKEVDFFLGYYDSCKLTSELKSYDYGRYSYFAADISYYDDDKKFGGTIILVQYKDIYYLIQSEAIKEYSEQTMNHLGYILASLCFDDYSNGVEISSVGDKSASAKNSSVNSDINNTNAMVAQVLQDLNSNDSIVQGSFMEPIAAMDDFNHDGVTDLLVNYQKKDGGSRFYNIYELWSFPAGGPRQIDTGQLCQLVGGNYAYVGIVEYENNAYLAVEKYEPEAEELNNYLSYYPWKSNSEKPEMDGSYYIEAHGIFDKENQGNYILGDSRVEYSEYSEYRNRFSNWTYKLDLENGSNGNVKTFEELLATLQ